MAEDTKRKTFNFERIELFKSETLGTGSYGIACKAKCDQLLCAAKIIYPVLLEVHDQSSLSEEQNHMTPYQRFEQECHFLSQINHPTIVQYIQTYREPETGNAILLMELMDESLTHFLQSASGEIPVHVQINICHDVVLALSFLHSNGMIHRDLSSNNILLNNGGARAKVTDFGMSVFMETSGSRTLCPGTVAYMPPEALNEPPIYTDKLDCFSFGCCVVQICTRIWPEPKPRFNTYQVQDPRNPTQTTEAQLSVPEIERRVSHVQMISATDLLRPIALDCLKDKEQDRPSAAELCVVIEGLKESQKYQGSVSAISNVSLDDKLTEKRTQFEKQQKLHESEMQRLRLTVEDAHQEIRERNEMFVIRARQLQKISTSLAEKERENEKLKSSIAIEGNSIIKQDEWIQSLEEQLRRLEGENSRLKHQLEVQDQTIRDQQQISKNDDYQLQNVQYDLTSTAALLQQVTHQLNQAMIVIQEKDRLFSNKKREIRQVEELLLQKVDTFQESLELKRKHIQDLEKQVAAKDHYIGGLKKELKSPTDSLKFKPTPVPRQSKNSDIVVRKDVTAPLQMHAGSFVTINSSVFLRPYDSKEVYEFNVHSNRWITLAECPTTAFTLASIQGNLAAVGGRGSKAIHNIGEVDGNQKWIKSYPQMIHERASSCAASNTNALVVAGGLKSDFTVLSSVEALMFRSFSWSIVTSLPYSLHSASATICGGNIYLGGGYYMKSRSLYSVLTCNLNMLFSSTPDHTEKASSLPRDLSVSNKIWRHIANLPVCCSTITSFQDNLVAVGGKNIDGIFSNTVYKYNVSAKIWEEAASMQSSRSNCLIGTLSNKIIVVGGCCEEGISDKVEMITV